jgi:hypothetical protein
MPIKIALIIGKELHRSRKVLEGVNYASRIYPESYIIILLVGTLRGCGSGLLTIIDRFNRGLFVPNSNEILRPSLYIIFIDILFILFDAKYINFV